MARLERFVPAALSPPQALEGALPSAGLLALRLIAGGAMFLHGAPKMMNATAWMGPEGPPALLQLLAALAECGGGLAWMLGLLTPLASAGIAFTMAVGIIIAHFPMGDPLIRLTVTGSADGNGTPWGGLPTWLVLADGRRAGGSGSGELALLFIAVAIVLVSVGPGRYALDGLLRKALRR